MADLAAPAFHGLARLATRAFGGRYGQVPPPGPEPSAVSLATAEGRLDGLRWGDCPGGTPLLLLHGLGQNACVWARCAALLARDRDVVAISMPGHGRSASPPSGYSLPVTAAGVVAALDALGWARAHVAGHSWGGKVAMVVAADHPERVGGLVLCDPVPPQGLGPVLRALPGLVDLAFAPERGPFPDRAAWEGAALHVAHMGAGGAVDAGDMALWAGNFEEGPDGQWTHRLGDAAFRAIVDTALAADVSSILPRISAPIAVLQPTFTVGFWPGAFGPLRRAGAEVRRLWGDHTFVHTNPIDTAEAIGAILAEWEG